MNCFAHTRSTAAMWINISILDKISTEHLANFITVALMVLNCITPGIKKLLKVLN